MKVSAFILILFAFSGQAQDDISWSYASPTGDRKLVGIDCNGENYECMTYLEINGKKILVYDKVGSIPTKIRWVSKNFLETRYRCGSPCENVIYLRNDGRQSIVFEDVIAVDPKRELVVVGRSKYDRLDVVKIFEEKEKIIPINIKLDFSIAAYYSNIIKNAKFLPNGDLYFKYSSGKDYVKKEAIVSFDFSNNEAVIVSDSLVKQ